MLAALACGHPDGRESARGGGSDRSGGGRKRQILPNLVLQFIKKKVVKFIKFFLRVLCRDSGR